MSLADENKMLYILHRNGVCKSNIKWIMNDIRESNVFCDSEDDNHEYDWDFLEEQALWLFDSNVSSMERITALKKIKAKQEEYEKNKKSQYSMDQEERVQNKIKELIEKGIIDPDDESIPFEDKKTPELTTRYGRSPLHEAVAMRDICLVKKYLKIGKFLDKVDNNGHTAMEMAYYDDYKEALVLFENYTERSKTG